MRLGLDVSPCPRLLGCLSAVHPPVVEQLNHCAGVITPLDLSLGIENQAAPLERSTSDKIGPPREKGEHPNLSNKSSSFWWIPLLQTPPRARYSLSRLALTIHSM